jgi:ATP-binding cassette, subfamily A (ABC1), member 3
LFKIFDFVQYTADGRFLITFVLLFFYGLAHVTDMYFFSYFFKLSSTGFAAMVAYNILTSQATLITIQVLALPQLDLKDVGNIIEWFFMALFPNYSVG